MKIAFVVQDLCGQGAQASTAATIREFVKRGWAVDLLLSPSFASSRQKDGVWDVCFSSP